MSMVFLVNVLLYSLFLFGIVLCFHNSFSALSGWFLLRHRLSRKKREAQSVIVGRLSALVYTVTGKDNRGTVLLVYMAAIFSVVFFIGSLYYTVLVSLIIALLTASVPILSLVSKLFSIRNRSSNEGQSFIGELFRQYKISGNNIYAALEKTSAPGNDYPACSRQCYLLLLRLRCAAGKEEIRQSCRVFSSALGSMWGRTVGLCIENACRGVDISSALLDVMGQLKRAKSMQEEKKRLNSEAMRMTTYLVPLLYIGTIVISVKFLNISFPELMKNQFLTPGGFMFFIVGLLLFVINSFILSFISGSKLDY